MKKQKACIFQEMNILTMTNREREPINEKGIRTDDWRWYNRVMKRKNSLLHEKIGGNVELSTVNGIYERNDC
jgi:hypothetical protein